MGEQNETGGGSLFTAPVAGGVGTKLQLHIFMLENRKKVIKVSITGFMSSNSSPGSLFFYVGMTLATVAHHVLLEPLQQAAQSLSQTALILISHPNPPHLAHALALAHPSCD